MYDVEWVEELPVLTAQKTNGYHDTVEVKRTALRHIVNRRDEYQSTLTNMVKLIKELEQCRFLLREEAESVAKIASGLHLEYSRAMGVPMWSCSGKVVDGNGFFKIKLVESIDTSG